MYTQNGQSYKYTSLIKKPLLCGDRQIDKQTNTQRNNVLLTRNSTRPSPVSFMAAKGASPASATSAIRKKVMINFIKLMLSLG